MNMSEQFYELSEKADQDMADIFDFTGKKFGIDQAVHYVSEFEAVFQLLVTQPQLGKKRDEIRIGLRSLTHSSHIVFYRLHKGKIRIVRILHGNRDLPKYL